MIPALYMIAVLVGVGLLLKVLHRPEPPAANTSAPPEAKDDEDCCGMHITCERDSLLASVSHEIEYYDDEELDRFSGRPAADYSAADIEEFRDVLLTLLPDDIAGWGRSLQLRGIELPQAVRDELLMIVAETRQSRLNHA